MATWPPAARTCWYASGTIALVLASCTVPAAAPCVEDTECPSGYRCVQAQGACRATDPVRDAAPGDAVVDAAVGHDADSADQRDAGTSVDVATVDHGELDRVAPDVPDAAAPQDVPAVVEPGQVDAASADSASPDLLGFDVATLVCGSSFGFTPDPPVAGQTLEVHYYSTFRYASLDLLVSGAGDPVVTGEDLYDFGSTFTFIFNLSTVQAGVLNMTLVSGAVGVDACARLISP